MQASTLVHLPLIPSQALDEGVRIVRIFLNNNSSKLLCFMACWNDITAERRVKEQQYKDIERKNYLEERIHQIATAMEEMSMTVNEVAGNTTNAADSAAQVVDKSNIDKILIDSGYLKKEDVYK